MKPSKILIIGLAISLWAASLFADNSQFQIRLVLDAEDARTTPHDILLYTSPRGENIQVAVAKDIILSVKDVKDASIRVQEDSVKDMPDVIWTVDSDGIKVLRYAKQDKLNLTTEPRIEFELTVDGAKKLADFSRKNIRKFVAVIGNNGILEKVMIMDPIESGKIQIFAHTDKVNEMVKLVEDMGLKVKIKAAKTR